MVQTYYGIVTGSVIGKVVRLRRSFGFSNFGIDGFHGGIATFPWGTVNYLGASVFRLGRALPRCLKR